MSSLTLDETNSVVQEFSYEWKVHVKDLFSDHDVRSPAFNRQDAETGNWRLEMVGCQDGNGDLCVRVGLRLLSDSRPATGRVRFSIEGTEFQGSEVIEDFSPLEPGEMSSVMYALPLVVITKWANGKIDDQNLTVHCHIWLLLRSVTFPMTNIQSQAEKLISSKLEREDLWSKQSRCWGCDIIIRCQNIPNCGERKFDRVSFNGEIIGDPQMDFLSKEFIQDKPERGRSVVPTFVPYLGDVKKPTDHIKGHLPSRKNSRVGKFARHNEGKSQSRLSGILAARASKIQGDGDDNFKLRRLAETHLLCDTDSETTVVESEKGDNESEDAEPFETNLRGWVVESAGDYNNSSNDRDVHISRRNLLKSSSVLRSNSASFRDGPYTDFPAHRDVLRRRSPVFRQMLKDPCLNLVHVCDVDAATMDELLRFMYTGAVSSDAFPDKAEPILYAASKYDVAYLKSQCEFILSSTISSSNICRLMLAADQNKAAVLKESVITYAIKEHQDIFRTMEYRKFQNDQPELANELMLSVFSNVTATPELFSR